MPISCHFQDCKALLVTSLTHVSEAIASVQTFTFTFTFNAADKQVTNIITKLQTQPTNNNALLAITDERYQTRFTAPFQVNLGEAVPDPQKISFRITIINPVMSPFTTDHYAFIVQMRSQKQWTMLQWTSSFHSISGMLLGLTCYSFEYNKIYWQKSTKTSAQLPCFLSSHHGQLALIGLNPVKTRIHIQVRQLSQQGLTLCHLQQDKNYRC